MKITFYTAVLLSQLLLLGPFFLPPPAAAQTTVPQSPPQPGTSEKTAADQEEAQALKDAVRSSGGNPQALIKNLEGFLKTYPASRRRDTVLRFMYKSALQANDPQDAIECAKELLELNPDDPGVLSSLVNLLDRQDDASSRTQALQYATKLVERAEKDAKGPTPSEAGKDRSSDSATFHLATAYGMRGKLYAKSGETDKAQADFEKSYAAYPSEDLAERLGDLAVKKNDLKLALNEYVTAFVFPDESIEPSHRKEVREKLGSCYSALHHSEKGLGDQILIRYDELALSLAPRFKGTSETNSNLNDPFTYVLDRPDGPPLRLADYRGKILVLEFWATWCGPCRAQGKQFERVVEDFHDQPAAAFLAVCVDEDRSNVPAFLKQEQWTAPVAYARGLDGLLAVTAIPTLVIFDRTGRVEFRLEGFDSHSFIDLVDEKVREALAEPAATSSH